MDYIISNQKSISVKLQRLLMIMVAIIVASMTITACLEDENGENPDDNGNGGGGVAGKRLKTVVFTCSKPLNQFVRVEYSYNSDGTLKRLNHYDNSSKLLSYSDVTNNSDGLSQKAVLYSNDGSVLMIDNFTYNSDKTLKKNQVDYYNNGVISYTLDYEYKYENGKRIRIEIYNNGLEIANWKYDFDNKGRITTTVYTLYQAGQTFSMTYTRTYNSDGTIQKVTHPLSFVDDTPVTETYTWENGKTTFDFDMYETY